MSRKLKATNVFLKKKKKKNGIHYIQDWKSTTRHGVTRKRSIKREKHTGNLFRKNLKLKDAC